MTNNEITLRDLYDIIDKRFASLEVRIDKSFVERPATKVSKKLEAK